MMILEIIIFYMNMQSQDRTPIQIQSYNILNSVLQNLQYDSCCFDRIVITIIICL